MIISWCIFKVFAYIFLPFFAIITIIIIILLELKVFTPQDIKNEKASLILCLILLFLFLLQKNFFYFLFSFTIHSFNYLFYSGCSSILCSSDDSGISLNFIYMCVAFYYLYFFFINSYNDFFIVFFNIRFIIHRSCMFGRE
jgi:hypothetical protein